MTGIGMDVSVTIEGRELVAQVACTRDEQSSDQARLTAVGPSRHDDAGAFPFDGPGMNEQELGMRDEDWPAWYASYILGQVEEDAPAEG